MTVQTEESGSTSPFQEFFRTEAAAGALLVIWTALHGCAWLGGIGFTMSLFIATLAFDGTNLLDSSKVGILSGSILSGVVGAAVVNRGSRSVGRYVADQQWRRYG